METEAIEQTGSLDIHDGSRAVSLALCSPQTTFFCTPNDAGVAKDARFFVN